MSGGNLGAGMDELFEFCVRVIGPQDAAAVAAEAREQGSEDRLELLAEATAICRRRGALESSRTADPDPAPDAEELPLPEAVARELAVATAALPQRQREALALRELLGLSHHDIARVLRVEVSAVPPLLARGRLRLRRELRGGPDATPDCAERERSVRALAMRQDGELSDRAEDNWLLEHLGSCDRCTQAHAAMLEASVCYRAWRAQDEQGETASGSPAPA
jgi:hypothetical protein